MVSLIPSKKQEEPLKEVLARHVGEKAAQELIELKNLHGDSRESTIDIAMSIESDIITMIRALAQSDEVLG